MADELILDIESEDINKTQERIKNLSSKVKTTAQERDMALEREKEAMSKAQLAEKERDFYAGFADIYPKYNAAPQYKEQIKEKVMAGYSVEDATVAVLNKEGKLTSAPPAPPPPPPPAAGGSASTVLPDGGTKPLTELSRDEKRNALLEAEKRGDIST